MAVGLSLKLKFDFMETTYELFNWGKQSLLHWKIVDIITSFIWLIIFFVGTFEFDYCKIFKLLRWIQNLHQSIWDNEILYADSSSMLKNF
jgi:hypothetical protein